MGRIACAYIPRFERDEAARLAEEEVLRRLSRLSPLLDCDGHGAFFLGLEGLSRLVRNERRFAEQVKAALGELGFQAGVAIADGPFTAWVVARRTESVERVPPGKDRAAIFELPLTALGLSDEALRLLELLGVRTAGALLALPPGALVRRLGAEGSRIERLCRGQLLTAWPSQARVPVSVEEVSLELEQPTEELEALLFLFKSLLDRLLLALAHSRSALVELSAVVRLDDRTSVRRQLTPAEPTLDARVLLDLVRLWLGARPFAAPVAALGLVASRTGVAGARQLQLFAQREEEEARALERATERLAAAFGIDAVVRPTLVDTHRPEARLSWVPFSKPREGAAPPPSSFGGAMPLALKLFSPPEPVVWSGGTLLRPGQARAPVISVEGPHRLSGEWWEAPFDRSYYWLSVAAGDVFWVFRDEASGRAYLQALVD